MAEGWARLIVGANPARTAVRAGVLVAFGAWLVTYGILPVRGSGPSMLPPIRDGQLMIVGRLSSIARGLVSVNGAELEEPT